MDKSALPKRIQPLYDDMKRMLTPEAFTIWYSNGLKPKGATLDPLPKDPLVKSKPQNVVVKEAISQAREAVSGYSPTNGSRKAVEALADAVESII